MGSPDHSLCIAQCGQGTDAVDGGSHNHPGDEPSEAAMLHNLIDNGLDHVGAQQIGQGADGSQNPHQREQQLVPAEIGQKDAECLP